MMQRQQGYMIQLHAKDKGCHRYATSTTAKLCENASSSPLPTKLHRFWNQEQTRKSVREICRRHTAPGSDPVTAAAESQARFELLAIPIASLTA